MKIFAEISCLLIPCLFISTAKSQSITVTRTLDGITILKCNPKSTIEDISYEWLIDNDKPIQYDDKRYTVLGNELIVTKKTKGVHYFKCIIELKTIGAKYAVSKKLEGNLDWKLYRSKRHKGEALQFSTKMPPNKNFELGSRGKIHCKANGSSDVYWKRNQSDELPENVKDDNGTLIFENVDISMKGMYTCYATNETELISHQVEVRILPFFEIVPPKSMVANESDTVLLNCKGSGTIKWEFEKNMLETNEKFQIFENGSLLIRDVKGDDGGQYGCIIGNSAGLKRSETELIVKNEGDATEMDLDSSSLFSNKAVLITCLLAIVYIICVVVLMIWCRHRRGNKQENEADPEQMKLNEEHDHTNDEKVSPEHTDLVKSLSSSFAFDIRYEKILELEKIGTDSNLKMDILTGSLGDSDLPANVISKESSNVGDEIRMQQQTKVLIRTIKRDQDARSLKEFRRIVDLYCNVDSVNVAKLFGLSKEPKIYGLILEHSDDFKSYLTQKDDIVAAELLKFSHQLASGINSIHAAKLTHRDISLSNCIITKDNIIKLTSKTPTESTDYCEYNGHILPLRHSASELILNCKNNGSIEYTFASDIYAYGITMWEIFNKGAQPFKSLSNEDLIRKLLSKSLECNSIGTVLPVEPNKILLKCMTIEAGDRIGSEDLLKCLEEAMETSS